MSSIFRGFTGRVLSACLFRTGAPTLTSGESTSATSRSCYRPIVRSNRRGRYEPRAWAQVTTDATVSPTVARCCVQRSKEPRRAARNAPHAAAIIELEHLGDDRQIRNRCAFTANRRGRPSDHYRRRRVPAMAAITSTAIQLQIVAYPPAASCSNPSRGGAAMIAI